MDPKLKSLQAKWYKKLAKSGFVDIEYDEKNLKQFSGKTSIDDEHGRSKIDHWAVQGKITSVGEHWKYNYYQRCRDFLLKYEFKNKSERRMFEMHTEGQGVRVIAKELKTYRRKVHEIIQKLVKVMRNE